MQNALQRIKQRVCHFKCYVLLTFNYKIFVHEVRTLTIRLTCDNVTLGTTSSLIEIL